MGPIACQGRSHGERLNRSVVCNEFAARLDGVQPGALRTAIDQHRAWFWSDPERHRRGRLDLEFARREVVGGAFRRLGVEVPPIAEEIGLAYATRREDTVEPFPGAVETLGTLKDRGVRLALVTNGNAESQRRKIDRFGLEPRYIDMVFEILDDLQHGEGKTIVMVEQNAKKGLEFADLGYVLVSGQLAKAGPGDELLADPDVGRLFLGG